VDKQLFVLHALVNAETQCHKQATTIPIRAAPIAGLIIPKTQSLLFAFALFAHN
jgi:hypothetical protein